MNNQGLGPLHYYSDMYELLTKKARQSVSKVPMNDAYADNVFEAFEKHYKAGELFRTQVGMGGRVVPCIYRGGGCQGPIHVFATSSGIKMLVAGSTCTAWSSMGKGRRMCDETMVPFMILCFLVRDLQPHFLAHECTSMFDAELFLKYVGGPYRVQSTLLTPLDFGWPVCRRRRYTLVWNSQTVEWDGDVDTIVPTYGTSLELNGDIFFMEENKQILEEQRAMVKHRGFQGDVPVEDWRQLYSAATSMRRCET